MLSYVRRTGPLTVLCRFGALLCGMAFTWLCVAYGIMRVTGPTYGGGKLRPAIQRVRTIEFALEMYRIDHDRCPTTKDDLVANGYVLAQDLLDPWGRSIAYWCTDEDTTATSAGPDRIFGTIDDVSYPP